MISETRFKTLLVDLALGPDEGDGLGVVGGDEVIDVSPELGDGGEGGAAERLAGKDREPDLDLIKPGSPRRGEVEVHVGMCGEPGLVLLVGVEVVEDGMDFLTRMKGDDLIHEGEELDAATALLVGRLDFASGKVEGGEQVVVPWRV